MRNKKRDKKKKERKGNQKLLIIGISLVLLISFIFLVSALTSDEQAELDNLTSYLSDLGYSWLVNYSGSDLYPSVNVYRQGDNESIATFSNIARDENGTFNMHKVYLTALGENESIGVFDLKSLGDVEKIPNDIWMMKLRIEQIKMELKNG